MAGDLERRGRFVSKLTPKLASAVVASLASGTYVSTACQFAGLNPATYHQWRRRGDDELARVRGITEYAEQIAADALTGEDGKPLRLDDALRLAPAPFAKDEWAYVAFLFATDRARAMAEMRNITIIQQAAAETWTAAAWLLERTHREKYGRVLVGGTTADGSPTPTADSAQQVTADQLEDKLAEALRAIGKGEPDEVLEEADADGVD